MNEPSPDTQDRLDQERTRVLAWLRAPHRDLQFFMATPPSELGRYHHTIAQRFLEFVQPAGFDAEVIEITRHRRPAYEVRWTHRGSSFVGFKQPPPRESAADALLAGCAALLENEWCRARLPE